MDERTPVVSLPSTIQTEVAITRIAFPVAGTVQIMGGRSIIGATAGSSLKVNVQFTATSATPVQEMRVRTFTARKCANEGEMNQATWEPFVPEKTYTITVPINFSSFDVSAQYRDTQGNLSRIICADIAVEGMPPPVVTPSRIP